MPEQPVPSFDWEEIASGEEGPGPRSRHCLVHDTAAGVTVLFGGIIWDANETLCADTWELRSGQWSQVNTQGGPSGRHRGAMAYDERRGHAVLFGGQDERGAILGDTWIYQSRKWRQWSSWWSKPPGPRVGLAMTYDEALSEVVLFGGLDRTDHSLGDTWRFNGRSWHQVGGLSPPARRYAAFAYDPVLKGCLLHGGSDDESGSRGFGDTWLLRGAKWVQLPDGFDTDIRDDHGFAFHRAAKRMVMLEGVAGERGLLVRGTEGWLPAPADPLHPRHQCSPLTWDPGLGGLVMHGGEVCHQGSQFDTIPSLLENRLK